MLAVGLAFHTRSLLQATEREGSERQRVEAELKDLEKSVDFFAGPMTQTVALEGRGSARAAKAKVFLDAENGRLLLYVYDLPPLPSDRTYQLWVLLDGSPLSAGTFSVDADGGARLDPAPLPRLSGDITVAITVEPAGGVPQPTGPMVLVGS